MDRARTALAGQRSAGPSRRVALQLVGRAALALAAWPAFSPLAAAHSLGSKFDARRDAVADVAEAVSRAAAEGKHVIVDVGGEWCVWCHILERFVASHDEVRGLIDKHFVWVKVNYSPANKNERLLSAWPAVAGYPHLFVLDGQGRLIRSQPSAQLEGRQDYDLKKMLAFLRAAAPS
ncbi:MAG TPA: thioredoxin family protein [Ramlibacter sp.]|nr:thioredoxin family protein [Ramlibacter sp.]